MNPIALIMQILGLILVAAIVWTTGPVISVAGQFPLESELNRGLAIGGAVVVWVLLAIWQQISARKKNEAMLQDMATGGGQEVDEETAIIQERFREGLETLKASGSGKNSKKFIYDIPWYIIIGPPGSGKTTALLNSGLSFPLEEKFGSEALKGIGGTRHCDWWFTNEAVLIDTAGRFTSQDSHKKVDEAGWDQFIGLLKRYRKERPINGAMVTMSLSDLLQQSPDERLSTARVIRQRIDELITGLGITFPVYFMFTKTDMVSGFNEFFAHMGSEERAQVWGETFPLTNKGECGIDIADYGEHYDKLIDRLENQLIDRLHGERDRDNRAVMLSFPAQMLSLKQPVVDFVKEIFTPNRYSEQPLLRGVYYTSGTQEGTPIDQLLGALSRDFGMGSSEDLFFSGQGRSYFLSSLLRDVIFTESELTGEDKNIRRRKRIAGLAGYGFAATLLAASVGAWTLSYQSNLSQIEGIAEQVALDNVLQSGATQMERLTEELDALRAATLKEDSSFPSMGLRQSAAVKSAAKQAYQSSLESRLLPLLVSRVEQRLLDEVTSRNMAEVYRLLKAYLMYAGLHENAGAALEPEFLYLINQEDWQSEFGHDDDLLRRLDVHQRELVRGGLPAAFVTDGLVKQARRVLLASPLDEQIYNSIKQQMLQDHALDMPFNQIAGADGPKVFISRTGVNLQDYAMPGMFTRRGYTNLILPLIEQEAGEYVENNWVLGEHNKQESPIQLDALTNQIVDLYKEDYIAHWEKLLADLDVKQQSGLNESASLIETSAMIRGPIESMVLTIVDQAQLIEPGTNVATLGAVGSVDVVASRFAPYSRLAGAGSGSALDRLVADTRDLAVFIKDLANNYAANPALGTIARRVGGDSRDVFGSLRSQIPFLPPDVRRWMGTIQDTAWTLVMASAKDEINQIWRTNVADFYRARLASRYPLDSDATQAIEPIDFAEFFAPDGVLDLFVKNQLSLLVNTGRGRWTEKKLEGKSLGFSRASLDRIQKLTKFSESFYPSLGGEIKLTFTPVELGAATEKFVLTVGEVQSTFDRASGTSIVADWPHRGVDRSWYQFSGELGAEEAVIQQGPWSIFRLLEGADMNNTGRTSYRVTFRQGPLSAIYDVRISGAGDVFARDLYQDVTLPERL